MLPPKVQISINESLHNTHQFSQVPHLVFAVFNLSSAVINLLLYINKQQQKLTAYFITCKSKLNELLTAGLRGSSFCCGGYTIRLFLSQCLLFNSVLV